MIRVVSSYSGDWLEFTDNCYQQKHKGNDIYPREPNQQRIKAQHDKVLNHLREKKNGAGEDSRNTFALMSSTD